MLAAHVTQMKMNTHEAHLQCASLCARGGADHARRRRARPETRKQEAEVRADLLDEKHRLKVEGVKFRDIAVGVCDHACSTGARVYVAGKCNDMGLKAKGFKLSNYALCVSDRACTARPL